MIWLLLFFFFFFLIHKEFFFFSFLLDFSTMNLFFLCLIPLSCFIVFSSMFNFLSLYYVNIYKSFFFFIFFFLIISFVSLSPFFFLFFFELSSSFIIFSIFFFSKDSDKLSSVSFMLLINMLGSIPFIYFLSPYMFHFSSMVFSSHFSIFNSSSFFLCFSFILMSKIPLIFLHFWLTKAHVSAAGVCSMILASILLKIGTLGLMKFSFLFVFSSIKFLLFFFTLSIFTCLFFSLIMMRFTDLKHIIACSSILHMSFIFPLISLNSTIGIYFSILMMVGHGVISYYLFYLVSMSYELSLNRSSYYLKSIESLSKSLGMWLVLLFFLNMGFPPFINFLSELLLFSFFSEFSSFSLIFNYFTFVLFVVFTMFFVLSILMSKKIFFFKSNISNSLFEILSPFYFTFYMFCSLLFV